MLKEFQVRFYDNDQHKLGTLCVVSALDRGQSMLFCDMIAKDLKWEWKSDADWEFVLPKKNID